MDFTNDIWRPREVRDEVHGIIMFIETLVGRDRDISPLVTNTNRFIYNKKMIQKLVDILLSIPDQLCVQHNKGKSKAFRHTEMIDELFKSFFDSGELKWETILLHKTEIEEGDTEQEHPPGYENVSKYPTIWIKKKKWKKGEPKHTIVEVPYDTVIVEDVLENCTLYKVTKEEGILSKDLKVLLQKGNTIAKLSKEDLESFETFVAEEQRYLTNVLGYYGIITDDMPFLQVTGTTPSEWKAKQDEEDSIQRILKLMNELMSDSEE